MIKFLLKLSAILIFFILLLLTSCGEGEAATIFLEEDFSDGVANGWVEGIGTGRWDILSGEYVGTVVLSYPERPIYSYFPSMPTNDYTLELDVKSVSGVDKAVLFRFNSINDAYVVNLRSEFTAGGGGGNDISLGKFTPAGSIILKQRSFENFENTWYHLTILVVHNSIRVYVDNELLIDFTDDLDPILSGAIGLLVWPGGHTDPVIGNITTLHFDNIVAYKTPETAPLVFLPGMTACWSWEELIKGEESDDWSLFPFLTDSVYGNLFESLESAGWQEGRDWHVFCYDWRKPLDYNATKLKEFIDGLDFAGGLSLAGHSMGGLIARVYLQKYPNHQMDRVIIYGSPHEGAVKAYPAWEGGQVWSSIPLEQFLIDLYILRNKSHPFEHPALVIRREIPSIKDLLPTFSFLVDKTSEQLKDIDDHIQKNLTMMALNRSLIEDQKNLMFNVYGVDQETFEKIKVTSIDSHANWIHYGLGLWEDGEPVYDPDPDCPGNLGGILDGCKDYSKSVLPLSLAGDGTVLARSATISGVGEYSISTDHRGIIGESEGIQQLFDKLGIAEIPVGSELSPIQRIAAFWIESPAEIKVIDTLTNEEIGAGVVSPLIENGFYDEDSQFIVLPNFEEGPHEIVVTGTGEGDYKLSIAVLNAGEFSFVDYMFPVPEENHHSWTVNLSQLPLELINLTSNDLFESAKTKIKNLNLDCPDQAALVALQKAGRYFEEENYEKARSNLKTSLHLLGNCALKLPGENHLFPEYESIAKDLVTAYRLCSVAGNSDYDAEELEEKIEHQEDLLAAKSNKFQKKPEKKTKNSSFRASLFIKVADLISEVKNALTAGDLALAEILEFQIRFLLKRIN